MGLKYSFEFFPAKTPELHGRLHAAATRLAALEPAFFSVTYGAGGSTQNATLDTVTKIQHDTHIPVAAHLTCVGADRLKINDLAHEYWQAGIHRLVALRGDMPGHMGEYVPHPGGYAYAAELVAGLIDLHPFDISVAAYPEGHPQAPSPTFDRENLRRKLDAGAHRAITQFCLDTDAYLRFRDACAGMGITKPVVPGVLLMTNFAQTVRFAGLCGTAVPKSFVQLFDGADTATAAQLGTLFAMRQCEILVREGFEELHFYTLNKSESAEAVLRVLQSL